MAEMMNDLELLELAQKAVKAIESQVERANLTHTEELIVLDTIIDMLRRH